MISINSSGGFEHVTDMINGILKAYNNTVATLERYGEIGVEALSSATPMDSGKTANSWGYEIEKNKEGYVIYWTNSNINDGVNIAVILQYGHGTGYGGYVQGRDYINPTLRPIFDELAENAWREVTAK